MTVLITTSFFSKDRRRCRVVRHRSRFRYTVSIAQLLNKRGATPQQHERFIAMIAAKHASGSQQGGLKVAMASLRDCPAVRDSLAFCCFGIAYYLSYRYAMYLRVGPVAPLWIANAVLLCALLRARRRWWWLLLLSTLPIRLLVALPPTIPASFPVAGLIVDCVNAVALALLLQRLAREPARFGAMPEFGLLCLVVVLFVPAAGACLGAAVQFSLGHDYWTSWEQWFYGDVTASLIITPAIFYWILRPIDRDLAAAGRLEALLLTCGLFASTLLSCSGAEVLEPQFYAPVPFLLWAALRFGMTGTTAAVALIATVAIVNSHPDPGPFGHSTADVAVRLLHFLALRAAPLYMIAVLIKHRQRAEQSLRESERHFREMADSAPVLIWMSDTSGLCQFFNDGWLNFTGRTLDQERGNGWTAGVHLDDLQHCLAVFRSSFDARQPFEMDYRLRRHDAEYRWILDKGVPRYAANGAFLGYVGSAVDVTDRRRQEAALRESEERYRDVVESQTDFVCRFLPDMSLTFVNEACCRCLGSTREHLLGRNLIAMLPQSAQQLTRNAVARAAARLEPSAWEYEMKRPDTTIGWHSWMCRGIFAPGGELREFQAVGHDITDRKQAEDATAKLLHTTRLAAVGELTAMIAHEINQPLCAILSNAESAELLLQSPEPPLAEIRNILADIRRDDLRADQAIRGIRALTQTRVMQLQPVDLNEAIMEILGLAAGDALRRHVQILQQFHPSLPLVAADRICLEQVLLNLIINGMDAMEETPETARQLTVQTKLHGEDGAEVAVLDCGHGIAEERMEHLFDSFFTTKTGGLGLGLSIARSIIRAHRGRIWAENRDSGGAALRFTLRTAE
jgi:two-component system, LuxR family, sensor kinase FixL